MHTARHLLSIALIGTCTLAFAQQKGELWENTMNMEMDGGAGMPAMTQKQCQLPAKGDGGPTPPLEDGCQLIDQKKSGNKFMFKYACDNAEGKYTGTGEFEFASDNYTGVMRSSGTRRGKPFNMTMKIAAKKLGVCDYVDKGKEAEQKIAKIQSEQTAMMAKECDKAVESLDGTMVFPSPNIPTDVLFCKERRNDFCAKAKSVSTAMTEPAGYDRAIQTYNRQRLAEVGKSCGVDFAAPRIAACNKSAETKNWQFMRLNCVKELANLRAGKCDFEPKTLSQADQDMCNETGGFDYTAIAAKKGNANAQTGSAQSAPPSGGAQSAGGTSSAPPGDKPADPAKGTATTTDKLKEGADKLKKFLKF